MLYHIYMDFFPFFFHGLHYTITFWSNWWIVGGQALFHSRWSEFWFLIQMNSFPELQLLPELKLTWVAKFSFYKSFLSKYILAFEGVLIPSIMGISLIALSLLIKDTAPKKMAMCAKAPLYKKGCDPSFSSGPALKEVSMTLISPFWCLFLI